MTGCTATLTIFPDRDPYISDDVDSVLTCMTPRGQHQTYTFAGEVYEMHQPLEARPGGLWGDDWPGATPHAAPPVSDAEVEAALDAYYGDDEYRDSFRRQMANALKAAAAVRPERP